MADETHSLIGLIGASYRGPAEIVRQTPSGFNIFWGDKEGAYSSLDYDSGTGEVSLKSDISGQLALRYAFVDGRLYVASHDILLAPFVPFEVDQASMDHLKRFGWSVGGYSLIKGITVCSAGETVKITDRVERAKAVYPAADPSPQETVIHYLAERLPNGEVVVEMSAGFDSRAALAATLASKPAHLIRAFSEGPADSQDVSVAREICRLAGISFERRQTTKRNVDDILSDWTGFAVRGNGHVEVNILPSQRESNETTVCGDGGEIFRDYFTPYQPFANTRSLSAPAPEHVLGKKFGASDRLKSRLEEISRPGDSNATVLNRFYLTDRFGVWNQKLAREGQRRVSPFYARDAMGDLSEARQNRLHLDLISTHLPVAFNVPINGEAAPALYSGAILSNVRLDTGIFLAKVKRRLVKRQDLQAARNDAMKEAMDAMPEAFLHGTASTWAERGAQRFLQAYKEASQAPS